MADGKGLGGIHEFRPHDGCRILVNWIGGGNESNVEGERLKGGKGPGGVHDSRLCDSGHILATCVSGVLEVVGMLWRDGKHREVCLFRWAV